MNIASVIRLLINSEIEKYLSESKALKIGDMLTGKVIEVKGEGKALVDFGKFRAVADIKFEVKTGDIIKARVADTGDKAGKIVLNIDQENVQIKPGYQATVAQVKAIRETFFSGKIIEHIEKFQEMASGKKPELKETPFPPKNEIARIKDFFVSQDPKPDLSKVMVFLKKTVRDSGVFFEKKIQTIIEKLDKTSHRITDLKDIRENAEIKSVLENDLKSNLLKLRQYLGRLNPSFADPEVQKSVEQIKASVEDVLSHIKNQQEAAVKKLQNNEPVVIMNYSIPLRSPKDKGHHQMKVYLKRRKSGKGKKSGVRISLLLEMNQLGSVRSDLFLLKNDLNITFFVSSKEIKAYFDSHISRLSDNISDYFSNLMIKSIVSEEKIREFETENMVEILPDDSLIDLRI